MFRAGRHFITLTLCLLIASVMFVSRADAQQWRRSSEVDPVEGTRRDIASYFSSRGSAYVRCQGGLLEAYVIAPSIFTLDDGALVRFRFLGGELYSQFWSISTSGDSFFSPAPGSFARELARRSSLAMDIYGRNGSRARVIIPLTGSGAAIRPVLDQCEIPTADLTELLPEVHYQVIDDLERESVQTVRAIGVVLLSDEYDIDGPARPLNLYRAFNEFWLRSMPAKCLEENGEYRDMKSCPEFLRRRSLSPDAGYPVGPMEALREYTSHRQALIERRSRPAESPAAASAGATLATRPPPPRCTERDQPPRPSRPFNVERAYPQRLLERGVTGEVTANVRVGSDGGVLDVEILTSNPPGAFDSAVDREVRRMRFSPARQLCQDAVGVYELSVRFGIAQ